MKEKVKLFDIKEARWEEGDNGMRSCVFKPSKAVTTQFWEIKPGAGAEPHKHPNEQLIYIQQGVLDVTVEGETYEVGSGCYCYVPPNAVHSTVNNGPQSCINIDFFFPERDDRSQSERERNLNHKNWK